MVRDAANESFPNAPLIELVASLRWSADDADPDVPVSEDPRAGSIFLRALSRELAREGYVQSERLVPEDQEVVPAQPLYRYLSPADGGEAVVYQAGERVLTVNAIPPYRTWAEFRPAIERGLRCLTNAFQAEPKKRDLDDIALNYIDAFDDSFTKGDRMGFLRDSLGFDLRIPSAISGQLTDASPDGVFVQFSGRGPQGDLLQFKSGLATVANSQQVVLDMTVRTAMEGNIEQTRVMDEYDRVHAIVHDTFLGLSSSFMNILRGI